MEYFRHRVLRSFPGRILDWTMALSPYRSFSRARFNRREGETTVRTIWERTSVQAVSCFWLWSVTSGYSKGSMPDGLSCSLNMCSSDAKHEVEPQVCAVRREFQRVLCTITPSNRGLCFVTLCLVSCISVSVVVMSAPSFVGRCFVLWWVPQRRSGASHLYLRVTT